MNSRAVQPYFEVYTANVRAVSGSIAPEKFGIAMARVAFHELEHYLRQERNHGRAGLFAPALTARDLTESGAGSSGGSN